MSETRKRYSSAFKFQLALEAAKEGKTINQIAGEHGVHPNQVSQWKRQLVDEGPKLFRGGNGRQERELVSQQTELFEQIGRLKMELEWLKKRLPESLNAKRKLIEAGLLEISIRRQCELIGLNRASLYYAPAQETAFNLQLMRLIDEQYTRTPFYGYRRMTVYLDGLGHEANHKRVARLMAQMGLEAIYPKPRTTVKGEGHVIYPYLLRGVSIVRADQVWSTDITYIRMVHGFMYLVAVMDWWSRYVLSWRLSNTLDGRFCNDALDDALQGKRPEIFNTDQGSQFTSRDFTGRLEDHGIRISMDGRGRALDNVFVERLWRTVKYEDIYLKEYARVSDLEEGLKAYFRFYNAERPHQALNYRTPEQLYRSGS